jgi:hypothetical protein
VSSAIAQAMVGKTLAEAKPDLGAVIRRVLNREKYVVYWV